MITIEIAARWIGRCEGPEIMIDLRGAFLLLSTRKRSVILRDRLHRPIESMTRDVLHECMKSNARRIGVQTDVPGKLNSCLGIGGARQLDLTVLTFRKLSKGEWPIIQHVRVAWPMLFVVISLGQEPELVPAVVEPLIRIGRQVLARELGIHKQISVSAESHLDQTSAILRNHDELHPAVRDLLCVPALIVRRLNAASCTLRQICLAECWGQG